MTDEAADTEDLLLLQGENRHLKDTIVALRDEMETARAERADEVQRAAAHADAEVGQLHETISALRSELEGAVEDGRQQVYETDRTARGELGQYQDTIRELRARLEGDGARER
ncbi:MAG: hypothetical protein VX815_03155 [Gemmatimonadota bacterium]|nr:hypothetical protein [Gemmatimonadota bacterium]